MPNIARLIVNVTRSRARPGPMIERHSRGVTTRSGTPVLALRSMRPVSRVPANMPTASPPSATPRSPLSSRRSSRIVGIRAAQVANAAAWTPNATPTAIRARRRLTPGR